MAFGRLERSAGSRPMSEINMTPLIDVMLVLLVIFIVTAPLMATRLRLDLPQAEAGRPDSSMAVLEVALDAEGRLFIGQSPANLAELAARAREAAQRNPATEVQLRADRGVAYGRVAELIGVVQAAGLNRVGFVTETPPAPK